MKRLALVLDLLYPPKCVFCQRILPIGTRGCCESCINDPDPECTPIYGSFFLKCAIAHHYSGQIRDAFLRYKFQGYKEYSVEFGRIMADCIQRDLAGEYDLLTWVPVSEKRRKKRGFDQALELAVAISPHVGLTPIACLHKVQDNQAQSGLDDKRQRSANVMGVYDMLPGVDISGRSVLLIDDIITTGSTLEEASRVLLSAGASQVVCAAFAHRYEV